MANGRVEFRCHNHLGLSMQVGHALEPARPRSSCFGEKSSCSVGGHMGGVTGSLKPPFTLLSLPLSQGSHPSKSHCACCRIWRCEMSTGFILHAFVCRGVGGNRGARVCHVPVRSSWRSPKADGPAPQITQPLQPLQPLHGATVDVRICLLPCEATLLRGYDYTIVRSLGLCDCAFANRCAVIHLKLLMFSMVFLVLMIAFRAQEIPERSWLSTCCSLACRVRVLRDGIWNVPRTRDTCSGPVSAAWAKSIPKIELPKKHHERCYFAGSAAK